mgnify:CR=1 FL=1
MNLRQILFRYRSYTPLPFLALFKFFPMFSRISHAYRFVIGLSLGCAAAN